VPAIISSGITLPSRTPGERLAPLLWPGYQYLAGLNKIRDMRMTMSDRVTNPDAVIEQANPAAMQDLMDGVTSPPTVIRAGEAVMINGKMVAWPGQVNLDLDKIEQSWANEYGEFRQQNTDIDNPELYTKGTATIQLQQLQARGRLDSEPIGNKDWAVKEILEMLLFSMDSYKNKKFKLLSSDDLRYGYHKALKKGEAYTLSAEDKNFNYVIKIETQQVTDQEKRLTTEAAWIDYAERGTRTFEQVLDTMYDDPGEQWEKLAIDAGLLVIESPGGTFSEMKLNEVAADLAWLEGGYLLQNPAMQAMLSQGGDVASSTGSPPASKGKPSPPAAGGGMQAPMVPGGTQGEVATGVS
jgi:hypothetical protein